MPMAADVVSSDDEAPVAPPKAAVAAATAPNPHARPKKTPLVPTDEQLVEARQMVSWHPRISAHHDALCNLLARAGDT